MNIFAVNTSPIVSAQELCDKHIMNIRLMIMLKHIRCFMLKKRRLPNGNLATFHLGSLNLDI